MAGVAGAVVCGFMDGSFMIADHMYIHVTPAPQDQGHTHGDVIRIGAVT